MISHHHICRLPSQKRCSYRLNVDSDIELGGKAIPKHKEYRKGWRAIPSVVGYEFSHGSPHTCQSMPCHGSRMSRKDWHKCALELIYSLWLSASFKFSVFKHKYK